MNEERNPKCINTKHPNCILTGCGMHNLEWKQTWEAVAEIETKEEQQHQQTMPTGTYSKAEQLQGVGQVGMRK